MIKYFKFLTERYGSENDNILKSFLNLPDMKLKLDLPQIRSKRYKFNIIDNKIVSSDIENIIPEDTKLDQVVLENGGLIIGSQHYRMSDKSIIIKACGELKIKDGKIIYLNNESGHYKPSKKDLSKFVECFNQENLLHPELKVDYLYEGLFYKLFWIR